MDIQNLDQLIAALEALRVELGGNAPVRLYGPARQAFDLTVTVGAIGKGDTRQRVSRGGIPCIFIGEP